MTEHKLTPRGNIRYSIDFKTDKYNQLRGLAEARHTTVSGLIRLGIDMLLQDEELRSNPSITPDQRLKALILASI